MAKSDKRGHRYLAANFHHAITSSLLPPIGVFWDIENCQVPKGKSAMAVAQMIRDRFFNGHREAEFMCVCDISKENKEVIQELNNAQVTVVHINATGKNAADDKLRQSMRRFADIHGHPATMVLISGDVNFAADLSDFRHRRRLRIIIIHNYCAPEALLNCAHQHYNFSSLVAEIPFRSPVKFGQQNFELVVSNLPVDQNVNQIRSRLKQLSDNCGGRVASVNQKTAVIRFPTAEAATRARKRMDKEDVFGNKIAVNFPHKSDNHENDGSPSRQVHRIINRNYCDDSSRESSPNRNVFYHSFNRSYREGSPGMSSQAKNSVFPPPPDASLFQENLHPRSSWNSLPCKEKNYASEPFVFGRRQMTPPSLAMPVSTSQSAHSDCYFSISSSRSRDNSSSPNRFSHWKPIGLSTKNEDLDDYTRFNTVGTSGSGSTCSSDGSRASTPNLIDKTPKGARRLRGTHKGHINGASDSITTRTCTPTDPQVSKGSYPNERPPRLQMKKDRPRSHQNTPSPSRQFTNSRFWTSNLHQDVARYSQFAASESSFFENQQKCSLPSRSNTPSPLLNSSTHFQPISHVAPLASRSDQHSPVPVELQVTNLDQRIETKEMKKILLSLFRIHVMVLHVSVLLNLDGNLMAVIKVPSIQDAQYAISQLHRKKIGSKRILISFANDTTPSPQVLRSEVIALLSDVPGKRLPLFKFRELFEKRYHHSISASDLYKMKMIAIIQEDISGRMVCLNPDYRGTPSPASSDGSKEIQEIMEKPYCEIHCPNPNKGKGWAEKETSKPLPNVHISFKTLSLRIHTLLHSHNGSLVLGSFPTCYKCEFGDLEECKEGGVPLEHLIGSVPGIEIIQCSAGIRKIQWIENKVIDQALDLRSSSPPLASKLSCFSREIVDLMKNTPSCVMSFHKFIPAYHHHFGRQCRVADYGYTKLLDLLESLPHVIQILGEGNKRMLTLAHRAQIKRFTADILRVLKSQASKQITLEDVPSVYFKCFGKEFNINNYGVCEIADMLSEVPENVVLVTSSGSRKIIAIPKREQTPEEVERTRQFATEAIELLRHSSQCRMAFNKFIPAYHHHFGRQCRVADYGFTKLIELFEAIPDMIQILDDPDDKILVLTEKELTKVFAEQMVALIKSTKKQSIPLHSIPSAYTQIQGHSINLCDYKVNDLQELLAKISHAVKIVETKDGLEAVLADPEGANRLLLRAYNILAEEKEGKMKISEFLKKYSQQYGQSCEVQQVRKELEGIVKVEGSNPDGFIKLVPLQLFARNVQILLQANNGRLLVQQFENAYLKHFGTPCHPVQYGFPNYVSLFQAIPDTVTIRGKGFKKVLLLNKDSSGLLLFTLEGKSYECDMEPVKQLSCVSNDEMVPTISPTASPCMDSAVPVEDEELLHMVHSPVDLLSDPVPSGVPSPCLQPNPLPLAEKDLIRFDSPTPSNKDTKSSSGISSPVTVSLGTAFLRAMILGTSEKANEESITESPNQTVMPSSSHSFGKWKADTIPAATSTPDKFTRQSVPLMAESTSEVGPYDSFPSQENSQSCEDLSQSHDSTANSLDLPSSQSTPTHQSRACRSRTRCRIAAHFSNPISPTI